MDLLTQIKASADFILKQSKYKPEIGLILGSGLGSLADTIEDAEYYNYSDIPNFPTSTVISGYGFSSEDLEQGTINMRTCCICLSESKSPQYFPIPPMSYMMPFHSDVSLFIYVQMNCLLEILC